MNQPSWIGKTLSGRYLLEEILGQGGMSAVYKADDPNLRRTVAVKLIHSHLSDDPQFVSRFEEEAAAVAQLRHPNIIQVFDFEHDGNTYYMVLEFVPGETLQARLKRLNEAGRMMEPQETIEIAASVCDALQYAHARGMIHRDIKPANIMLNVEGEAILMDFGIAKIVGGKRHTATGAVVGTAIYMSPEQIKGESIDARVDIYALGVTLFEMLSGRPPFEAESAMTTLMMHINDPVPDLSELNPDVPQPLIRVIEKALAKNRDERYKSAAEFAAALRQIDSRAAPTMESETAPADKEATEPMDGATTIEEVQSLDAPGATMIEEPTAAPAVGGATTIEPQPAAPAQPPAKPPPAVPTPGPADGGLQIPRIAIFGGIGAVVLIVAVILGISLLGGGGDGGGGEGTPIAQATATQPAISTTVPAVVVEPTDTPVPPTATVTPTPSDTPTVTTTPTETVPPGPYVRINEITIEDNRYVVEYETFEYTEQLPGTHIHFYYDTVTEANAGSPGSGPWFLYGGPRPFTGYTLASRPAAATQMCARVANPNHSIIMASGNCVDLPESS